MKTLLLSLIAFIAITVAAPVAQAGQFARVHNGRGIVYVHKSQLYSPYYGSNYSNHRRHHHSYRSYAYSNYYRPSYRSSYYRSSYHRSYPSYYQTGYDNSYNSSCGYHSRPRVAISFGF